MNELGCRATALPQTDDVDVARPTRLRLAAVPEGALLAILRETGLPFHEVPELSRGAGATSWKARGSALRFDLLVPAKGVPYRAVAVPELRAHVTALPSLDFLAADSALRSGRCATEFANEPAAFLVCYSPTRW